MQFINCVVYLVIMGVAVFLIGRIFPRKFIFENSFPFNCFKSENGGKVYEKLKIKKWKTKLPDASRVIGKFLPSFLPVKKIGYSEKEKLPVLIKETCVAESTHFWCAVFGFVCVKIWKGVGGYVISIAFALFNVPFIVIQRYNRPRLKKALAISR